MGGFINKKSAARRDDHGIIRRRAPAGPVPPVLPKGSLGPLSHRSGLRPGGPASRAGRGVVNSRAARLLRVTAMTAFCLLGALSIQSGRLVAPVGPGTTPSTTPSLPPESSSQALHRARRLWTRAKWAVESAQECLEGWDPGAASGTNAESWRLSVARSDPGGYLRRARAAAWSATVLARTREEAWRAAEVRVLLAHAAGRDCEELRAARAMATLFPERPRSWLVLRTAAEHNRLPLVARRATAVLAALGAPY